VPAYRHQLANIHGNLGVLLAGLGKGPEAERQYRQALALQEKLAADSPAVPQHQIDLGGSCCNLGNLVRKGDRPEDSLVWYEKAIRTLTAVYEQDRQLAVAKEFLRNSHWGRAEAYDRLRKYTEALQDWDRAIDLSTKAQQLRPRANRATTRVRAGRPAEALAEVAELLKTPNLDADQCYELVCFYAVASGKIADKKQEYADRAMELLRQAVKAGYNNAAHLRKDTDLDALRSRPDFQQIMKQLDAKNP
jgi:tetratricopeptide (TPR) repeat protein